MFIIWFFFCFMHSTNYSPFLPFSVFFSVRLPNYLLYFFHLFPFPCNSFSLFFLFSFLISFSTLSDSLLNVFFYTAVPPTILLLLNTPSPSALFFFSCLLIKDNWSVAMFDKRQTKRYAMLNNSFFFLSKLDICIVETLIGCWRRGFKPQNRMNLDKMSARKKL